MTPEERSRIEQALANADAAHTKAMEAGDQQLADEIAVDARELANMLKNAGPAETPAGGDFMTGVEQTASGFNEGLADVIGGPVDLMQGAMNLGSRGINALLGTEIEPIEGAFMGSDWIKRQAGRTIPGVGQIIDEPVEGYERARKIGEYTGAGLGTALTLGAGGTALASRGASSGSKLVDNLANTVAQEFAKRPAMATLAELTAAPGAVYGGEIGGNIGENVGGERGRSLGEFMGEMLGGTAAPMAIYGGGDMLRGLFAADDSAARLAAAEQAGVRPSYGLIGNQNAQYLENVSGLNPIARGQIEHLQRQQVEQTADFADDIITRLTGQFEPALDKDAAGRAIRSTADDAYKRLQDELGRLTHREMSALGGETAALRVDKTKAAIKKAMPRLTPTQRQNMNARLRDLDQMRITGVDDVKGYAVPKGTPVDPALDTQIRNRLNNRIDNLQRLEKFSNPDASQKRAMRNLRHRIKTDIAQIEDNLGVRNDQFDNWRREMGQDLPERGAVGSREQREAYAGVRSDQRLQAQARGDSTEFSRATAEKKRLSGGTKLEEGGEAQFLRNLTHNADGSPKEAQAVYDYLMKPNAAERIQAYKRSVSDDEFKRTMGDMISVMGQPRSQSARISSKNTETFSPAAFMTNFDNLPQATKQMFYDVSGAEHKVEQLRRLSQSLASRGTASNPSGTTATAIIASIFGKGVQSPVVTFATLFGNRVAADIMASPAVARVIGKQYPQLVPALQKIIAQRSAASAAVDTSEPSE